VTRWLVTGAGGQLGRDAVSALGDRDVVALTRAELDLADPAAVHDAVLAFRPDVILNTGAYTAVDAAEIDEARAHAVNAVGPRALAESAERLGSVLIQVSTDYVFAGDADRPYPEDAPTAPRSAYGRTKAAGERAVLETSARAYVVRTAWVYGAGGANFVKTMVRLERERSRVSVVADQRGSPTWSWQLAQGLVALGELRPDPGIYHCTNAGETSWHGLARAVFEELGADPDRVDATTTAAFPRPAPRPAYSVLAATRWQAAGLAPMPPWRAALSRAFATVGEQLGVGEA